MRKSRILMIIFIFIIAFTISGCEKDDNRVLDDNNVIDDTPSFFGLEEDCSYTAMVEYRLVFYNSDVTITVKRDNQYTYVDYYYDGDGIYSWYEYYLNNSTEEITVIDEYRMTYGEERDRIEPYLYDIRTWSEDMFIIAGENVDFSGTTHDYMMKEEYFDLFNYSIVSSIRNVWLDETEEGLNLKVFYWRSYSLVSYSIEIINVDSTVIDFPE